MVCILNVRLAADEITPNNLLVGDQGGVIGCAVSVSSWGSVGEGVRGGVEPVIQLPGFTSLVLVQLELPGVEDEVGTGGRFSFE